MLDRALLANMAGINECLDYMDAAVGLGQTGGRFPVAALAAAMKRPDVNISRSQVGVVNTGNGAKIAANVNITPGADQQELFKAITALAQAVASSTEMNADTQKAVLELIATLRPNQPRSVVLAILKGIDEYVRPVASIFGLYEHVSHLFVGK